MDNPTRQPSVAGTVACVALVVLPAVLMLTQLLLIVPRTKKTLDEFGLQLPWLTKYVLQFGMWFHDFWWLLVPLSLAALVAVCGGLAWLRHGLRYRAIVPTALLLIPLFAANVIVAYALLLPTAKLAAGLSK